MKQRIIISLEPKQMATLKRLSQLKEISISSIIREAVERYTKNQNIHPATLLLDWLDDNQGENNKSFRKTDKNLSQEIDKLLYGQK